MTTTSPKEEPGNGDVLALAWERTLTKLDALAKTDPEKARAIAQAWIERIRKFLEELP